MRGRESFEGIFPIEPPSVPVGRGSSSPSAFRSGIGERKYIPGGVVARHGVCPMLSVVAMGMLLIGRRADRRHGSRGATPTIARRPHPVPRNRSRVLLPSPLFSSPSLPPSCSRTMQFACTCVHPLADTHARTYSLTHIYTHVCLTVPCTPFDNLNSCVAQRRLPLIVLSGNAVERNFLVYAPT